MTFPLSRAVYGTVHMKPNKGWLSEAKYRLPCIYCGQPHFRKCDFIVASYVNKGLKIETTCDRKMCVGCSTTYHTLVRDVLHDFCPEHDKILREMLSKGNLK